MEEGKCSGFIWCKSTAYPLHYIMQGLSMSIVFLFAHVHTLQLLAFLVHLNAKISPSTCPHWGAICF